jgi:hypothetical protein
MPALTRRRSDNPHHEVWLVYFGDVHVGTIGERAGVPVDADQSCGFYPGLEPGQHHSGIAPDLFKARAGFTAAWEQLRPCVTDANLTEWRRQRAFTAWKYRMWKCGCRMPTQNASGRSQCFCGAEIDNAGTRDHVYRLHMETAGIGG